MLKILLIFISSVSFVLFIHFLIKEISEVLLLNKLLKQIIGQAKIKSIDHLVKIKHFLTENIEYNLKFVGKKRPLLRHSATDILKMKYGFCGENSRVAIKLFQLGGMKARRVYLFREVWQHVVIEHQFDNAWYMFDAHNDPKTILRDVDVAKIPTSKLNLYPNDYPDNPYLNYCRIKLFYKIPVLKRFSNLKIPSQVSYLFESPYLILSFLFLSLSIVFLLIQLILFP